MAANEPTPMDGVEADRERLVVVAACRPYLCAVFLRRYGNLADESNLIDDLIQETLVQAIRALPTFKGGGDVVLRAWLRAILHRVVLGHVHRRDTLPRLDHEPMGRTPSPVEELIRAEEEKQLIDAVLMLRDIDRQVAEAWLLGVSDRELAHQIPLSESAIRQRRHRLVRLLRAMLADGEQSA